MFPHVSRYALDIITTFTSTFWLHITDTLGAYFPALSALVFLIVLTFAKRN